MSQNLVNNESVQQTPKYPSEQRDDDEEKYSTFKTFQQE